MELVAQRQLKDAKSIGFCCICGKEFAPGDVRNRQHIPPKAIFAKHDRSPPLILPAHEACNTAQSPLDTLIGQLVAALHGKHPQPEDMKLRVSFFPLRGGGEAAGVDNLPLRAIIFRWVRCFHAALYRSYLIDRGGMLWEPLPDGDIVGGKLVYEKPHISRPYMTYLFKQQVKAGRTDAVICYNGKCEYRCCWLNFDDGKPFCLFALRLYDWERLGDPALPQMGCVGYYFADIPSGATTGTRITIPVANLVPLDPFGP